MDWKEKPNNSPRPLIPRGDDLKKDGLSGCSGWPWVRLHGCHNLTPWKAHPNSVFVFQPPWDDAFFSKLRFGKKIQTVPGISEMIWFLVFFGRLIASKHNFFWGLWGNPVGGSQLCLFTRQGWNLIIPQHPYIANLRRHSEKTGSGSKNTNQWVGRLQ